MKSNVKWNLKIKNSAEKAEIWIYGNIIDDVDGGFLKAYHADEGYVFPAKIREQLDEIGDKPVSLYFASDGGDVNAGFAIASIIQRLKGETTAYIDSWAASIASVIALACDKVIMPENTFLMIHNPSTICWGNAAELRQCADLLDTMRDSIIKIYKAHASEETDFVKLMDEETWLNAEDASKIWNHVERAEASTKAVAYFTGYDKAPDCIKKHEEEAVKPVDYSDLIKQAQEVLEDGK